MLAESEPRDDREITPIQPAIRMGTAEDDARDGNLNKPLLQISKLFLTWFGQLGETKAGRLEA